MARPLRYWAFNRAARTAGPPLQGRHRLHNRLMSCEVPVMKYERPLPDGMEEPDPAAVETAAVLELVLLLFNSWSDEQIQDAIETVGFYRHGHVTDYVDDGIKLQRRAAERAADILKGVWTIRQDHTASISPHPHGLWTEDDEQA